MAKILILEDEIILLESIENHLKGEGYEVYTATDGEEGLVKMKSVKPDLVMLDVIMPKMGGFEVMREMAKDENLSKIPIIVISNSGQPVEIDEAMKLGAKDFIVKVEFDPKEVVKKIKKQLETSNPETERERERRKTQVLKRLLEIKFVSP